LYGEGRSKEGERVRANIENYLDTLRKAGCETNSFDYLLARFRNLLLHIDIGNLPFKESYWPSNGLSQFAIKYEAAGKVRIFALLDSWTQTVLKPLHLALFDLLRTIPNDGTFDQDESVKRCQVKALKSEEIFSFDLSSATDRLPARLTGAVIESLTQKPGLGEAWYKLMTDRQFKVGSVVQSELKMSSEENSYQYAVGQPMGGLSSWAGLAITHHWILQYCSWKLGNYSSWDEGYEVLGDDIVIFRKDLAMYYLETMTSLGVDINPSKSLSSKLGAFEFAKRFCRGDLNMSPVSITQLRAAVSIAARVTDTYTYIKSGVVNSVRAMEVALLENYAKAKFSKELISPALSVLGLLADKSVIEHRTVIDALVDPVKGFSWDKSELILPLRTILKWELDLIRGVPSDNPLKDLAFRKEQTERLLPLLIREIVIESGQKAQQFLFHYHDLIKNGSKLWFRKYEVLPIYLQVELYDLFKDVVVPYLKVNKLWDSLLAEANRQREVLERGGTLPFEHTIESAFRQLDEVEKIIQEFTYTQDRKPESKYDKVSVLLKYARKVILNSKYKAYFDIMNKSPENGTNTVPEVTTELSGPSDELSPITSEGILEKDPVPVVEEVADVPIPIPTLPKKRRARDILRDWTPPVLNLPSLPKNPVPPLLGPEDSVNKEGEGDLPKEKSIFEQVFGMPSEKFVGNFLLREIPLVLKEGLVELSKPQEEASEVQRKVPSAFQSIGGEPVPNPFNITSTGGKKRPHRLVVRTKWVSILNKTGVLKHMSKKTLALLKRQRQGSSRKAPKRPNKTSMK
jgi:hypothetical protein